MQSALHSRQFVIDGAIALLQSITRDRHYRWRNRPFSRPIQSKKAGVVSPILTTENGPQPSLPVKKKRRRKRGKKMNKTKPSGENSAAQETPAVIKTSSEKPTRIEQRSQQSRQAVVSTKQSTVQPSQPPVQPRPPRQAVAAPAQQLERAPAGCSIPT